ncbi:hypothetical protein EYF80_043440 [Liparis tanakae]|uniref:Uncharacterized protein n=1 Tax=Liparis tanakae TaxID=230148 RepID=A0A4Z2G1F5_9TELE|nr:hypothetical protein EYF80_043440 [Liparis tanakae]
MCTWLFVHADGEKRKEATKGLGVSECGPDKRRVVPSRLENTTSDRPTGGGGRADQPCGFSTAVSSN